MEAGVGTNSSYRSETYGVHAGLKYAYTAGLTGEIKHLLDNESVTIVYANCETRGPSLVCSQDVWDDIIWYKNALRNQCQYTVEWRRGHAEKRGPILDIEDRANHSADGLAEAGYTAHVDVRNFFQHRTDVGILLWAEFDTSMMYVQVHNYILVPEIYVNTTVLTTIHETLTWEF